MYDWANSAFATTVVAGFYPIFFKQYWNHGTDTTVSTARLGLANSIAGIIVALLAPILGAIADKGSYKKKFLIFFAYLGVIMTSSLYMIEQGSWLMASVFFIFASIGFSGGNIFYDALINTVAPKKRLHMVSSLGFALGYLGGGILLALNIWMKLCPETFGLINTVHAIRVSFLSVGIWWAVFTIPLMLFVKEPKDSVSKTSLHVIKEGFSQLKNTLREIRHLKMIFLFLIAYWLYIDGVDTIIRMAVDYGMSIGFKSNDLILALLITQFIGFPSAIVFGYIGTRIGAKRAIFIAISVYIFICIWGALMHNKNEFYMLAVVIGLVQGGIQALSRSFYAGIIPANKSAEYFGFCNMLGRFATILGPVFMGGTALLVKSLGYSSETASRVSIGSILLFFVAGGIVLLFVNEDKAKEEIKYLK